LAVPTWPLEGSTPCNPWTYTSRGRDGVRGFLLLRRVAYVYTPCLLTGDTRPKWLVGVDLSELDLRCKALTPCLAFLSTTFQIGPAAGACLLQRPHACGHMSTRGAPAGIQSFCSSLALLQMLLQHAWCFVRCLPAGGLSWLHGGPEHSCVNIPTEGSLGHVS
jgi:hypothetical protein